MFIPMRSSPGQAKRWHAFGLRNSKHTIRLVVSGGRDRSGFRLEMSVNSGPGEVALLLYGNL
jgi:hypothetical protein